VASSRYGSHTMLASVIVTCVTLHVYFCQRSMKVVADQKMMRWMQTTRTVKTGASGAPSAKLYNF
jgi:hypothetical protein